MSLANDFSLCDVTLVVITITDKYINCFGFVFRITELLDRLARSPTSPNQRNTLDIYNYEFTDSREPCIFLKECLKGILKISVVNIRVTFLCFVLQLNALSRI